MARRKKRFLQEDETDPLAGMANLFDLGMVFAVALMVALISRLHVADLLTEDKVTMVKNPGKPDMEIIVKDGDKIVKYKASESSTQSDGKGRRVGIAYEMENGEIIYVPEDQ